MVVRIAWAEIQLRAEPMLAQGSTPRNVILLLVLTTPMHQVGDLTGRQTGGTGRARRPLRTACKRLGHAWLNGVSHLGTDPGKRRRKVFGADARHGPTVRSLTSQRMPKSKQR